MSKEAMKLALETLGHLWLFSDEAAVIAKPAIAALREALAEQPAQQEPVAWRIRCTDPMRDWVLMYRHPRTEEQFSNMEIQPLYTSPPAQRKPLTNEQFQDICNRLSRQGGWDGDGWDLALKEAIEAAHGIKENT